MYDLDYIISCDAGRGSLPPMAGHFAGSRLRRSFDTVHRKSQDTTRATLHAATSAGLLRGVIHTYLGMPDERIPVPLADLVPASQVSTYPTDFRAMNSMNIELLTTRGEQLTRALISHYCPELSTGHENNRG